MRFPEFTGEWKKFALSDFTERVTRRNKGNTCKLPLTISAQYGLVDQITFFNKQIASTDMSNYYLLKKGEFAYNKSYSGDYPWGAVKRLDRYNEGCLSSLYICFSLKPSVHSDYITHYFETAKWYQGISEIAGEGARNHGLLNIAILDYFDTKHYLPINPQEQEKIATLFNLLTERIETQNKIIQHLESLIKGISKMLLTKQGNTFIKDCLVCNSSTLQESSVLPCGKYPVYGATGISGYLDVPQVEHDAILIIKDGAGVGNVRYATDKHGVIGTLNYLSAKNGYNLKYLYYCLRIFNFTPFVTGLAIPHIYFRDYGNAKIYCPSLIEQKHIANNLSNIERKIEVEKQILEKLKEQKKYLLSQMFI